MKSAPVTVNFESTLYALKDWTILPVPKEESLQLGSRGQISIAGKLNGHEFTAVLEPDGRWSHWIRVTDDMQERAGASAGNTINVVLTNQEEWPEPKLPNDLKAALTVAPSKVKDKWKDITPMARWEWIRWMNATLSQETRKVRIEKTVSKLNGAHRRPCCFNLAACTESYVAKGGRLMEVDA